MEDVNMEQAQKGQVHERSPSPPKNKIKAEASSETNIIVEPLAPAQLGTKSTRMKENAGLSLVSGGKDIDIKLWDTTSSGTLTSTTQGFQGTVCDLAISSDNSLPAATLASNKLSIWDLNSGQYLQT